MKVSDLIALLLDWQEKHGPNAQVAVPSMRDGRGICREDIYIHHEPIATVLTSRGEEVEW